ncbi:L,D-transpeptidase family protein [Palleronia caenipelagi]|uniref:L,D-transpeptidase family protein n=1 Tax=Palleronia caenipelagi TaxID=2489174 RepID=UPI001FEC5AFE|nr:L,D-transpeptidase family protein [Palleronia caenipelagi]
MTAGIHLARVAGGDETIGAFYTDGQDDLFWLGHSDPQRARLSTFLAVADSADLHGLPPDRYGSQALRELLAGARTQSDLMRLDVEITRRFVEFADALRFGVLEPGRVVPAIKRQPGAHDPATLVRLAKSSDLSRILSALVPPGPEYGRLVSERQRLLTLILEGGWGPEIRAGRLELGDQGSAVVALRNRLVLMNYLDPRSETVFDDVITEAVRRFQADHGLHSDGIAGPATIAALNVSARDRLRAVLVAMERERWGPGERGRRHVLVNLTDFHARLIDAGEEVFRTRSVIGKAVPDRETPEFSDVMTHMVINPSWNVPRSIVVKEYLPRLRKNPGAVSHLQIIDHRGRVVSRGRSFSKYSARSFPYSMRQPPGPRNALGSVKFMFPNPYNIYLHDTPSQSLFSQPVRAFSHGCVRLDDPAEFAEALLAEQSDDPRGLFEGIRATGQERTVMLEEPVPVHLIYRTAIPKPGGGMEYRADIYGRDARIWRALEAEGLTVPDVEERVASVAAGG